MNVEQRNDIRKGLCQGHIRTTAEGDLQNLREEQNHDLQALWGIDALKKHCDDNEM